MRLSLVCAVALVAACGGSAERSSGGSSATTMDCEYDGKRLADGTSVDATDGCNTCRCTEGEVTCTEIGCGPSLECESASTSYGELMERAKTCDPQEPNPCTKRVYEGLGCGCDTFVNPAGYDEAAIRAAVSRYHAASCNQNVTCGSCNLGVTASCSAAGVCVTDSDPKERVACRVDGLTYQDGSIDVPDPHSCNTCECRDGRLICTEIDCPEPCPEGTVAARSCVECSPADSCLAIETGCFPSCSATCRGTCVDGACVAICG